LPITEGTDLTAAARLLEIFLDRVAWQAAREHDLSAEYLLDDNYRSALEPPDQALASALTSMVARLPR
jgi:hypothetical protein